MTVNPVPAVTVVPAVTEPANVMLEGKANAKLCVAASPVTETLVEPSNRIFPPAPGKTVIVPSDKLATPPAAPALNGTQLGKPD